jgi:hypothetical protein
VSLPEKSIEREIAENVMKLESLRGQLRSKRQEEAATTDDAVRARLREEIKKLDIKEAALATYTKELQLKRKSSSRT